MGAALGLGALVGFLNGFVVAKLKINALITTPATMQIVRGFGFIISGGTAVGIGLEVISACVLGGVSLKGGVGSMALVIAGVLIMGIVQNAMNLLNVAMFYQYGARGLILLAAVLFDRWKRRQA